MPGACSNCRRCPATCLAVHAVGQTGPLRRGSMLSIHCPANQRQPTYPLAPSLQASVKVRASQDNVAGVKLPRFESVKVRWQRTGIYAVHQVVGLWCLTAASGLGWVWAWGPAPSFRGTNVRHNGAPLHGPNYAGGRRRGGLQAGPDRPGQWWQADTGVQVRASCCCCCSSMVVAALQAGG